MKKQYNPIAYILFAIVVFVILASYVFLHNKPMEIAKEDKEYPILPAQELFVPIHADTLDVYLKTYFNRGGLKTDNKSSKFVIEYTPNAFILLHANNNKMKEAREVLENAQVKGFSIQKSKETVKIVMKKNGDYVDCPALIVAEILRKLNEQ